MPSLSNDRSRLRPALLILLLMMLTVAAMGPVVGGGFVNWDDREQLTQNPHFNPSVDFAALARYWLGPYTGSLYPISYTLFGLLAAVGRLDAPGVDGSTINPHVFHTASLALHALAVLVVFAMLRRLTRRIAAATTATAGGAALAGALVGAAAFAVHPLQVEPVAWVSGMNTVLSGLLALVAVWQYIAAADARGADGDRSDAIAPTGRERARLHYTLATVAYVLALLAKPSAVVAPLLVGLIDRYALGRPLARVARAVVPWLVLAVPVMLVTRHLQTASLVTPTPLWSRPIIAVDAIGFYLYQLVVPIFLIVDYGRAPSRVLEHWSVWVTWIPVAAAVAAAWSLRRRLPEVALALALFIAGVVPVLGLTPFNGQTMSTVSDRFLYLSMLGLAVLIAAIVARWPTRAVQVAVAVLVGLWAVRSHARAWDWRDEQTLFTRELRINPLSLPANQVLGHAAAARGVQADQYGDHTAALQAYATAAAHYERALRVKPDDVRNWFNLGNAWLRQRRWPEAIAAYDQALQLAPARPDVHYNRGVALYQSGRPDAARAAFEASLASAPDYPLARAAIEQLNVAAAASPATATTGAATATTDPATTEPAQP